MDAVCSLNAKFVMFACLQTHQAHNQRIRLSFGILMGKYFLYLYGEG